MSRILKSINLHGKHQVHSFISWFLFIVKRQWVNNFPFLPKPDSTQLFSNPPAPYVSAKTMSELKDLMTKFLFVYYSKVHIKSYRMHLFPSKLLNPKAVIKPKICPGLRTAFQSIAWVYLAPAGQYLVFWTKIYIFSV